MAESSDWFLIGRVTAHLEHEALSVDLVRQYALATDQPLKWLLEAWGFAETDVAGRGIEPAGRITYFDSMEQAMNDMQELY